MHEFVADNLAKWVGRGTNIDTDLNILQTKTILHNKQENVFTAACIITHVFSATV